MLPLLLFLFFLVISIAASRYFRQFITDIITYDEERTSFQVPQGITYDEERIASQELQEIVDANNASQDGERPTNQSRGTLNVDVPQQASTKRRSIPCLVTCLLGGFTISYVNASIGNMIAMDGFLKRISYNLIYQRNHQKVDEYCTFYNMGLQLSIATYYIIQIAGICTSNNLHARWGRKLTMITSSLMMLTGIIIIVWFPIFFMVYCGFVVLSFGIGLASKVIDIITSETAPKSLPLLVQVAKLVGTLGSSSINFFVFSYQSWGWRVSIGVAGVTVLIVLALSFFLIEIPLTLVEPATSSNKLLKPLSRPPLIITLFVFTLPVFSAVSTIQFYSPILFQSNNISNKGLYLPPIIISVIQIAIGLLSLGVVKMWGRRRLLIFGSLVRMILEVMLSIDFYKNSHRLSYFNLPKSMLIIGGFYVAMDAVLNMPSGWLEVTFPAETTDVGKTLSMSLGLLQNAITASISALLICKISKTIFFLFMFWDIIVSVFIIFFVPETSNIKVSEIVSRVWSRHWLWKRYVRVSDTYE